MVDFSPRICTDWVLQQLGAIRRSVADNRLDTFDMISEYIADNASAAVTIFHTGSKAPNCDFSRLPRGEIRVRYDVYRASDGGMFDRGTLLLDRTHFRKWLAARGGDYKSLTTTLELSNADATPRSGKAYLGKHTPIKLGQSYVLGVNLSHARMRGILDAADQALEDLAYGQIKAV